MSIASDRSRAKTACHLKRPAGPCASIWKSLTMQRSAALGATKATVSPDAVSDFLADIDEYAPLLHATFGSQCDVHVDTRPGVGTAVRLRMPAVTAAEAPSRVLVG